MKTLFHKLLFIALLSLAPALVSHAAEDLKAVRARMEQRLSNIDELKSKGALGEGNEGFLILREPNDENGEQALRLLTDENWDRMIVYIAIAEKHNISEEEVGRARARRIAAASAPGVWLQRENGQWYKK